jgi:hypothetical protein
MTEFSSCSSTDLDRWIEKLTDCKPLTEVEIKLLCEQVSVVVVISAVVGSVN